MLHPIGAPFSGYVKKKEQEWSSVFLSSIIGTSNVYKHFKRVSINSTVKRSFIQSSDALQKASEDNKGVCVLCKEAGKSLGECLFPLKKGETTNNSKHLRGVHKDKMKELAEKEAQRVAEKTPKRQCSIESFGNNVVKKLKVSDYDKSICNQLNNKIFKYVNNGSNPDITVENPNFCGVIHFCINSTASLKS